jgi:DNA-binding PadR family transcriptional regulator
VERKLLLLGLLRIHEMHGYQLNELIDHHLGTSGYLTKPTAYRLLNTMTADGWIAYTEEREGNRPARRVYRITREGEAAFRRLLREGLASYEPAEFHSDVSVAFVHALPADEAASLLRQRRAAIVDLAQTMRADDAHHGSFQTLIEHRALHLTAELEWLDRVIVRLESGTQGRAAAPPTHSHGCQEHRDEPKDHSETD